MFLNPIEKNLLLLLIENAFGRVIHCSKRLTAVPEVHFGIGDRQAQ